MNAPTAPPGPRLRLENVVLAPLYWLERSRGWRRRLLILLYLTIFAFVGLMTWRATSLAKLPDVGDPFDVEAFVKSSEAVPEDRNAFTFYRRASAKLVTGDNYLYNQLWIAAQSGWRTAGKVRPWVEEHREALNIWRQGTERPEAVAEPLVEIRWCLDQKIITSMGMLGPAAILEGVRLEAEEDMAGAWSWYRAVLRSSRHMKMRSRMEWRSTANALENMARTRLIAWAKDPKTGAKLLREALDWVVKFDEDTPPASDNLKVEYLALKHSLDDPIRIMKNVERVGSGATTYEEMKAAHHLIWFLKREPERSQRVLKLFVANRLAQVDRPLSQRPPTVGNDPRNPIWTMYEADPSAPPAARAIAPKPFFGWLMSTSFAWQVLPMNTFHEPNVEAERAGRALLIVTLAEQLYQREHKAFPAKDSDLVGPYLKRLPEGYENVAPPEARR